MKHKVSLAFLMLCCILLPGLAQTKPATQSSGATADDQDDVVKITTNVVQVDAVVTKGGKTVPNLTAQDFEIYEDGRRQTITSFAYVSNVASSPPAPPPSNKVADVAPPPQIKRDNPHRTIALVVDDLGLSAESMAQVRQQLRKFIDEELQPNDLVAVMRTSGELGALQQGVSEEEANLNWTRAITTCKLL